MTKGLPWRGKGGLGRYSFFAGTIQSFVW